MTRRAGQAHRILRQVGFALGAVGLLAAGSLAVVYATSERALERRHAVSTDRSGTHARDVFPKLAVATPELLERGRHLVTVVAQCTTCHGPDLAGREVADDPWIGRLSASNLTRGEGGVGGQLTDADWIAALRRGVRRDGRSLLLMPAAQLARLSDADLAAIVAYVRQVPPVDRVWPERRTGWLTRIVVAAGLAPDLIAAEQVAREAPVARDVTPTATVAYGEYLVAVGGCRVCHRADLGGGLHPLSLPGEPVPPALTGRGAIAGWSRDEFARAMRDGTTPDGRRLDREFMPWPAFAGLADVEIEALWLYLGTLRSDEKSAGSPGTEFAVSGEGRARG
ncbi:MAG: cytochrome c [Myxococcota bacterium]